MSDEKTVRVRIQHDGGPAYAMRVTDVNTGKTIENISGMHWSFDLNDRACDYGRPPVVKLTVHDPIVDVIVDAAVRKVCPCCGRPVEEQGNE